MHPNQGHLDALAKTIENNPIPMAVVDYVGTCDGDGWISEGDELRRMYGTRDMRHVAIYKLKVISLNAAARARQAQPA